MADTTEIAANSVKDISNRGVTNATLAKFKGKPRQCVVNIDDGYRPVVMDGETLGGKFKSASVDEVAQAKAEVLTQALTQEKADALYLGKSEKPAVADKATTADSAVKATQDASGNVITETYATKAEVTAGLAGKANTSDIPDISSFATKTELSTGLAAKADTATMTAELAKKANASHTHTISNVSGLQDALDAKATTEALTTGLAGKLDVAGKAQTAGTADTANALASSATVPYSQITGTPSIPDTSGLVPKSGARGTIAGYESIGSSTTINASSADSTQISSSCTVNAGSSGTAWTKIVRFTGTPSVSFGSGWSWSGGSAPTMKSGSILVLCWCGSGGIASLVTSS